MKSLRVFARRRIAWLGLIVLPAFAPAQVNLNSQLPLPTTKPALRQGQLGESYLLLDLTRSEQRGGSGSNFGPSFGANFAVTEHADITTTVTRVQQSDWPDSGGIYQLGMDWTLHLNIGRAKPFAVAGVGYQFSRTPSGGDFGLWNAGGGVEFLVAPGTAVTVKAVNVGSFSKGISNPWQYGVGLNHWFAKDWAANASVIFVEDQVISYSLGVRWGF
jgi:hypothetical protein